jgi:hypothetical protein
LLDRALISRIDDKGDPMMPYAPTFNAMSSLAPIWWKNAAQTWEIALAAPFVVAARSARLLTGQASPTARDSRERFLMGYEKFETFGESLMAMSAQAWRLNLDLVAQSARYWWAAWPGMIPAARTTTVLADAHAAMLRNAAAGTTRLAAAAPRIAQKGLKPVHRRVTANAKRLRRVKRRGH